MKNLKKLTPSQVIPVFVFITLVLSTGYSTYKLITVPSVVTDGTNSKGIYLLMLLQCILGILMLFLPSILAKRLKFEIPDRMYLMFVVFLYCAIYLGEVRSFYYHVSNWDTILHTFSGAMLGCLGFSAVNLLNDNEKVTMNLSPLFVAIFACCFAVTLGVIWEFYEYAADSLFNTNMQKTVLENGVALRGTAAVSDTMEDLFVDFLGAVIVSIVGYFSLKLKKVWLGKFEIVKVKRKRVK